MYLEKLQLNGFKSFANLMEMKFTNGITAVVGPNGSGKSNVADAIRWALGEQSMKTIRGKKAEDVIFAGSDKKSRLGLGEVSLFLNNEDGQAPIDYSELVLTRRFYRSREGEYLLNNSKARLTDIQLLLAKANVGQKTYSVIGQGQVDNVLVASPKERKDFFDEATGVKQYQIKRDEALNKLQRTHDNLVQGLMVLNEIEPRLRSLTRQVKRYEQKEKIEIELKALQNYHYYNLWLDYREQQEKLENKKVDIKKKLSVAGTKQDTLRQEMTSMSGGQSREQAFTALQVEYERTQNEKQQYLREQAVLQGQADIDLQQSGGQDLVFLKRRREELELLIKEKQTEEITLQTNYSQQQKVCTDLNSKQQQVLAEWQEVENKILSLKGSGEAKISLKEIEAYLARLLDKVDSYITKLEQIEEVDNLVLPQKQLQETRAEIDGLLKQISQAYDQNDGKDLVTWETKMKDLLLHKDNLVQEVATANTEVRVLETQLGNVKLNRKKLEQDLTEVTQVMDQQKQGLDLSDREKELEAKVDDIDQKLEAINVQIKEFNKVEQAKKEELLKLQQLLQDEQVQIDKLNQESNTLDVEGARLETKIEDLSLEVHRETNIFMASLVDEWLQVAPSLPENLSEENISGQIDSLKHKKELIGGIEPEVVGEYKEVKEKHDFLKEQTSDLKSSLDNLMGVIKELDEIITKQFTENFKQINELFNKYFRMLFSGGKAELQLLKNDTKESNNEEQDQDSDDEQADNSVEEDEFKQAVKEATQQLISGIEIKATPPGKKMKSIGMLSGGERALTSIALICAMIANNPSPFVVLDEVDAALDEANSIRFAEIISELSSQTQFVVITHNRATMEKADILYGVTMGGDGVSNLLSIKFEQAQEYANRY